MNITGKPLYMASYADWRAWLQENHAVEKEIWLLMYRKGAAIPCITIPEAVEEALCFGWIDSHKKGIDNEKSAQRFTPRKKGSIWSEVNKKRVAVLIEQGRMTEAGMARIIEAKQNGEWDKAAERENINLIPGDLQAALVENPIAQANFEKLAPSHKKQFLGWIYTAKTETTRSKRIQATIGLLEQGKKLSS